MAQQVPRDEMIARLKADGVTDTEIAELLRHSARRHPDREPPAVPPVRYRVRNWRAYNQALIQRGSLTLWVDAQTIAAWLGNERTGCVGAPTTYADTAIRCLLMLKAVFRLPLRQTQGFTASIFGLLGVTLPVPTYSTLSRRAATLILPRLRTTKSAQLHLVIDASGLKIYGEGEWQVRQHGWTKHRTWRKLHLGVDERTGEIVAQVLTPRAVAEHTQIGTLLRQVSGRVHQISADGGYDYSEVYRSCERRRVWLTIPPRRGAAPGREPWLGQRNEHITRMREIGRDEWKREVGYHRRSLVETAFFRLKTIFGDRLSARKWQQQQTEAAIRCAALNRMTRLGMPDSYAVPAA
jgi:IS5 family transposase